MQVSALQTVGDDLQHHHEPKKLLSSDSHIYLVEITSLDHFQMIYDEQAYHDLHHGRILKPVHI